MASDHRFPNPGRGRKVPVRIGLVAGAMALAAGGAAAVILPRTPAQQPSVASAATLSSTTVRTGAAQAAVNWADTNQGGAGLPAASVLKVEADTENGVPVFDVRVKAPNGSVWDITVSRASLQVLRASQESSGTTPVVSPSSTPSVNPEAKPSETPEAKSSPGVLSLSGSQEDLGQKQESKDSAKVDTSGSKDQSGSDGHSVGSSAPTKQQGNSPDSSSGNQSDG